MRIKYLIPIFLIVLVVGCGKKELASLNEASSKMKKLDNYQMSIKTTINDNGYSLSNNYEVNVDQKNKISKIQIENIVSNNTYKMQGYADYNSNSHYLNENDIWYKKSTSILNLFDFNIFSSTNSEEKIDSGYKLTLKDEQIKKLINIVPLEIELDTSNLTVDVTVNDKYITKIAFTVPVNNDQYKGNIEIVYEFSKFNEIENFKISDEALNSYDEATYLKFNQILMYFYEASWNIYSNKLVTGTFNDVSLQYSGNTPSKVEVNYADSVITNGVIEIDGYRGVIKNGNIEKYETIQ